MKNALTATQTAALIELARYGDTGWRGVGPGGACTRPTAAALVRKGLAEYGTPREVVYYTRPNFGRSGHVQHQATEVSIRLTAAGRELIG
jgi:hypothetical protein